METKICTKCNKEFPKTNEFFYFKLKSLTFINKCFSCKKEYDNQRYILKKEEILKKSKEWRKNNPEKYKAIGRKNAKLFRQRYPEKNKEKLKEYYIKNREKLIEAAKVYEKKRVENITDSYILNKIFKLKSVPSELIEANRKSIILKRKIKQYEQSQICN